MSPCCIKKSYQTKVLFPPLNPLGAYNPVGSYTWTWKLYVFPLAAGSVRITLRNGLSNIVQLAPPLSLQEWRYRTPGVADVEAVTVTRPLVVLAGVVYVAGVEAGVFAAHTLSTFPGVGSLFAKPGAWTVTRNL